MCVGETGLKVNRYLYSGASFDEPDFDFESQGEGLSQEEGIARAVLGDRRSDRAAELQTQEVCDGAFTRSDGKE